MQILLAVAEDSNSRDYTAVAVLVDTSGDTLLQGRSFQRKQFNSPGSEAFSSSDEPASTPEAGLLPYNRSRRCWMLDRALFVYRERIDHHEIIFGKSVRESTAGS